MELLYVIDDDKDEDDDDNYGDDDDDYDVSTAAEATKNSLLLIGCVSCRPIAISFKRRYCASVYILFASSSFFLIFLTIMISFVKWSIPKQQRY